jgi:hypothetical protein
MAKHRMTVEEHYSVGRIHPRGKVVDEGAEAPIRRSPAFESASAKAAFSENTVQDPEDRHDRRYNNDAPNDWRLGGNEDATGKPSFDRGNAWRMKDSNDWHSGHDPATIRKPEPNKP